MDLVQHGRNPIRFIDSATSDAVEGLLSIHYRRVQPESPIFLSTYDGVNQNIDIGITTVVVQAAPEPLIAMYDFIMNTFVPDNGQTSPSPSPAGEPILSENDPVVSAVDAGKIKLAMNFAAVQRTFFYSKDHVIVTDNQS